MRGRAFLVGLGLASSGAWAPASAAGNSGAADETLRIGPIRTFPSEAAARDACGHDPVVWADRYAGYLYFRREPQYGRSAEGAYACLHDAVAANYWDTGPLSSMVHGHGPGRVFPYTPLPEPPFSGS